MSMSMGRRLVSIVALGLCLAGVAALAAETMPASEVALTPEGKITVFHRSPATAADLQMPLLPNAVARQSLVYRARDRKGRDLLFYARALLETTATVAKVKATYLEALGYDAAQEVEAGTGILTLVAGQRYHFRMVTITPQGDNCLVRLERRQEFIIPPRVFTPQEQPIVKLLEEVARAYAAAPRVSYVVEQRLLAPAGDTAPPALTWEVDFTRPVQLRARAISRGVTGMEITARDGAVTVRRQIGEAETRQFYGNLTLDDFPELSDDPVVGLMLGQSLVNKFLDAMRMRPVKGVPATDQAELLLEYPDEDESLRFIIDLRKKIILRCETTVSDGDEQTTTVRVYAKTSLGSPPAPPAGKAGNAPR